MASSEVFFRSGGRGGVSWADWGGGGGVIDGGWGGWDGRGIGMDGSCDRRHTCKRMHGDLCVWIRHFCLLLLLLLLL
jgi:hypothetical protein